MSWYEHQHVLASRRPLGTKPYQMQHVLASTPACLVRRPPQHVRAPKHTKPSMSWRQQQPVLARTPACLGTNTSTRRPPWHALARTPTCLGVNTSMFGKQYEAASPARLGTNTSLSCGNTGMFLHKRQHVLASTPANSTRRPPQHVLARTPTCLGVNTSKSGQQYEAASPGRLGTNTKHVLTSTTNIRVS